MKVTMNFSLSYDDMIRFSSAEELRNFYRNAGCDGLEVMPIESDTRPLVLPDMAVGVHLCCPSGVPSGAVCAVACSSGIFTGVPHFSQNLAFSFNSLPHFSQNINLFLLSFFQVFLYLLSIRRMMLKKGCTILKNFFNFFYSISSL